MVYLLAIVCFYLIDIAIFHFLFSFQLSSMGFFSMLWLLFFIQSLLRLKTAQKLLQALFISAFIWLSGIHGFLETLIPLLALIACARVYHTFFITHQPIQEIYFTALMMGVYFGLRVFKMASELQFPLQYMIENHWWLVFLINLLIYTVFFRRLMNKLFSWQQRRVSLHHG